MFIAAMVGAVLSVTSPFAALQLYGQSRITDPPGARIERVLPSMIYVSVDRDALALASLIAQARQIRAANASDFKGRIGFFTSRRAARTFTMSLVGELPPDLAKSSREFLAFYDVENETEFLSVFPFGFHTDFKYARVRIEGAELPPCGFHVARRCLLRVDPFAREDAGLVGRVVLEARIRRDGKLDRFRVDAARNGESKQAERLVRVVLANVKTWWLESASEPQDVRITYIFGNTTDESFSNPELTLNAPGGVKILAAVLDRR